MKTSLEHHIKWLMVVIGLITSTMVVAALFPQQGLAHLFGAVRPGYDLAGNGAWANIVVRSWAMLIAITGGLLVYGAFNPAVRRLVIIAACISKMWFVGLNLAYGQALIATTFVVIAFDTVAVVLLLLYLFTSKPQ